MSAKNMMEETKVKLYDLKVNYQKNPMGIDLHAPVFSWSPENLIIGKCWYVMIPENWWALKSPSVFSGIYDGFKKCFKECPGKYLPSIWFGVKILQMC